MKIVILHLFVGTVLAMARFDEPKRGQLLRRLTNLRNRRSRQSRQPGQ
jgi:hypothetical protein